MRGELTCETSYLASIPGSSPHAWGTRIGRSYPGWAIRFIPTCVGNSFAVYQAEAVHAVHPHMRGELHGLGFPQLGQYGSSPHAWGTLMISDEVSADYGSSPHAWGTLARSGRRGGAIWFIPTCVGNSFGASIHAVAIAVHPHMRGELKRTTSP